MDPSSETMELHDNKNEKEVTKRCVACEEYTFYFFLSSPPHTPSSPSFCADVQGSKFKKNGGSFVDRVETKKTRVTSI